jgi:predicted ATPase
VKHPFSLAIALDYAAMLQIFRQDGRTARQRAEEAAAVCRKHGFAYYLSVAEILAGWAMAEGGEAEAGVARLRAGLEAFKSLGAEVRLPFYMGLLAEACGRAGRLGEALANISNGFAFQSKNGEVWAAADLHRVQGDLLLGNRDDEQARVSYQRSLEIARQGGVLMFERRAAARLAGLEAQNARSRAHGTL